MAEKEPEFIVVGIVEGEPYSVIGRCGDVPIHVGDLFDAVFRYKPRRRPHELGDDPVREVEEPTALRVVGIHAYQLDLDTLGQGMTGSLTLEGDGTQFLAPGWILGRRTSEGPTNGAQETRPAAASVERVGAH